jgi:hypothetical protein
MEEAKQLAIASGASPDSITIQSEYISERSLLRATATGNLNFDISTKNRKEIDYNKARLLASELFGVDQGINTVFNMKNYFVFSCKIEKKKLFFKPTIKKSVLVLDKYGQIRLSIDNAIVLVGRPELVSDRIDALIRQLTTKGSISENLAPQVHILDDIKITDFSSLTAPEIVVRAVKNELKKATTSDVAAIIKL